MPLGPPVQIAYAVTDVATAATEWADRAGAGPFFVHRHIPLIDVIVRGRPGSFDHSSAYGQWGPLMLELVEDHGSGPSPVRDMFPVGRSGLHHLAFLVENLDAATADLDAAGHQVAMSARTVGGTEFRFVDTRSPLGHMVELYEPSPSLRRFYDAVRAAADGWDGRDPVRTG